METYGFIYETTNKINGMKYIGKCIYSRQNDWKEYLGSGTYLKRAIKKYGRENFVKVILEEAYSDEELNRMEEEYILRFNAVDSPQYYNIKLTAIGGDIFTHNPKREEIRQMRIEQMSGEGNHQYGKPKTEKMIMSVKKANSRAVRIDDVVYDSQTIASKELGIGVTTIAYRLDSKYWPNYERMVPKNPSERYAAHTKTKPIEIDGVIYNGMKEAAKSKGLSVRTIIYRLDSAKHPSYIRLKDKINA